MKSKQNISWGMEGQQVVESLKKCRQQWAWEAQKAAAFQPCGLGQRPKSITPDPSASKMVQ